MKRLMAMVALAALTAGASLPAATAPQSSVSGGVNLMSATYAAKSETTVSLSSIYRNSGLSNFINLVSTKFKGLMISFH